MSVLTREVLFAAPHQIENPDSELAFHVVVDASRSLVRDDTRTVYFSKPYTGRNRIVLPVTDESGKWRTLGNGLVTLEEGEGTHTYTITVIIYVDGKSVDAYTLENIGLPLGNGRPISAWELAPLEDGEGEPVVPPAGWEHIVDDAINRTEQAATDARKDAALADIKASLASEEAASASHFAQEAGAARESALREAKSARGAAERAATSALAAENADARAADSAATASTSAESAEEQAIVATSAALDSAASASDAAQSVASIGTSVQDAAASANTAGTEADRAKTEADRAAAAVPTRVYARVELSATLPSSGSYQTLALSSLTATGSSVASNAITVDSAGVYQLAGYIRLPGGTTGGVAFGVRVTNTAGLANLYTLARRAPSSGTGWTYGGTDTLILEAGHKVEFIAWQNTGAELAIDASNSYGTVTRIAL